MRAGYETSSDAARAFGWIVSTYQSHENGHRGLPTKAAQRYARAFKVSASWLLTGEGDREQKIPLAPLVGYVGAGAEVHLFEGDVSSEQIDEVEAPPGSDEHTVAVIVRGDSMFPRYLEREIIYYRRANTSDPLDLIGREVVVRLADGRTFVKVLRRGSGPGFFNLDSYNAPPIEDVAIEWVVPVEWVKRT
ncbi:S24 family peptidase [Inquilinus sp.]|uniref:LexA family transcriptional regulator n=1 Tax=Inquilinus sp. TaxID=1932117 RepID=UPI0031D78E78